jgi:DNA-binding CsgD family transcriptional regulator
MPDRTPVIPSVALCDSRGKLVWTNHPNPAYKPGVPVWEYAAKADREAVKDRISRAAFFHELQEFDAASTLGEHYRVWIWPLTGISGLAACIVSLQVPEEIALLAPRELECLQWLSKGRSTAEIAARLDVSLSTVHTYLRRARDKLNLPTADSLIAFASRYCYPSAAPVEDHAEVFRTRT